MLKFTGQVKKHKLHRTHVEKGSRFCAYAFLTSLISGNLEDLIVLFIHRKLYLLSPRNYLVKELS
jgi:hypothetical protein